MAKEKPVKQKTEIELLKEESKEDCEEEVCDGQLSIYDLEDVDYDSDRMMVDFEHFELDEDEDSE